MNSHRTLLCIALVSLLALISNPTWADPQSGQRTSGMFVSGSVGAALIDFDTDLDDIGDSSRSGFSGRVSVGYWFSPYWGASVNYAELGDFKQRFANGTFRGSARSYGASLLGRLPIGERWALIGKMNLVRSKIADNGSTGDGFDDLFGKKTSLVLPSIELNYRVADRLTLLLELDARGAGAKDVDLGYAGAGMRWNF